MIDVTDWFKSETSLTSYLLAPRTDFHIKGTGLKQWAKNRLSTPFMATEKLVRVVSAVAGRQDAIHWLKRLVDEPTDKLALAQLETLSPHADPLDRKLGDVLKRIQNMTIKSQGGRKLIAEDIDWVMSVSPEQMRNNRPELEIVRDYINNYAKRVSDITQHKLAPVDRIRLVSNNPIMKVAFSLQSFMLKQTEFMKNLIVRELEIINKAYVNPDASVAGRTLGAARGVFARSAGIVPRLLGGAGFGLMALHLGHFIRGRQPDEDDFSILAGLGQIALMGYLGELVKSRSWQDGTLKMFAGPLVTTSADLVQRPGETAVRIGKTALPVASNAFDERR